MLTFEVQIHKGIGKVCLGMTREEVREVMGHPSAVQDSHERWGISFPDKDYFFKNGFQVNYDENIQVEYIEVAEADDYVVTFEGVPVHRTAPYKLIQVIEQYAAPDKAATEYPLVQVFPDIDLSLYRAHSTEDPFCAIGVGRKGYIGNDSH